MITVIEGLPDGVVGFEAEGSVSAQDYEEVIIPTVEAAASGRRSLRLLYHVTPAFEKFELGAMWQDARVGLEHLTEWDRIAVVTDVEWIRTGVRIFGFAVPGQIRTFANEEISEATEWLAA